MSTSLSNIDENLLHSSLTTTFFSSSSTNEEMLGESDQDIPNILSLVLAASYSIHKL
jgi:hypothetical protein